MSGSGRLVVCVPLDVEARAVRRGLAGGTVLRAGYRFRRSARVAAELHGGGFAALAVTGVAGALVPGLAPGDLVVASEVRDSAGRTTPCPSADLLAGALRRDGHTVRTGPLLTVDHIVHGRERSALAGTGALAVDMESAAIAAAAGGRPLAVVRAVVDTPGRPLGRPSTVRGGLAALRSLAGVGRALESWAAVAGPRRILLASPRSFCAGVERAIEIVERALERYGPPVYVRKQIVHNRHVVRDLEHRGAVFVDELDEVPRDATVVFSAHGVSPAVRDAARARELAVIDATCPLVTKVHNEAARFARRGDTVLLIGHSGHEETEGTMGEAPGRVALVETREEVARLDVEDPDRVSYVMQTTLATDEVQGIVDALRDRFPNLGAPASEDICYATTNRQEALRALAGDSDVVLVVGSANSSNSRRLVETAARQGTPAHLVDDATGIDPAWLRDARTVGLTAGASAPPDIVAAVICCLRGLGPVEVEERRVAAEAVRFTLPKEVRRT
ncbi:MAG: 4-hydroxy-3-methylbut-2-enyl diphosphate reductase [Carbonactinosporaceae bacterium]